jgi:DNA-binding MarR family transcriptional regulator
MASAKAAAAAWESLLRAQVTLMRRFREDDIWDELSMREYDVLFTLSQARERRLRLGELNEGILLAQPSLSRMVDRLEQRGLVRREGPGDDRRGTLVCLTADGAALQRRIGRRHAARIARYVGQALDERDLADLERITRSLRLAQADIPACPLASPGMIARCAITARSRRSSTSRRVSACLTSPSCRTEARRPPSRCAWCPPTTTLLTAR